MVWKEPHSHPARYSPFIFWLGSFLAHLLTFVELFLKQRREQSPGSPTDAPKQSSSSSGRRQEMLPRGPRVSPGSNNAQSASTYRIIAAGLGAMLPSGFKSSPRSSPGTELRCQACRPGNAGAWVPGPQGITAWPQMCAGLPANAVTSSDVLLRSCLPSS